MEETWISSSIDARDVGGKVDDRVCKREGGIVERVQIRRWSGVFGG
jgi:hypothetical protein